MKILVVGLQTHNAGKTTLCKALIHGCKKFDVNLVPFKPHSGMSYWNQFNAFQDGLVRGSLLSSDIMELESRRHCASVSLVSVISFLNPFLSYPLDFSSHVRER